MSDPRYQKGSYLEVFTLELFYRAINSESQTVPKAEIKMLQSQILFKDCLPKELEHRKKLYKVLEKCLIYLGIFEKHLLLLGGAPDSEQINTQIKGLKISFKPQLLLQPEQPSPE